MTGHELYKLITTKSIMFFIITMLIVNVFILCQVESKNKEYSSTEYIEFWNELTVEAKKSGWSAVLEGFAARLDEFDTTGLSLDERIALKNSDIYYKKSMYMDVQEELTFQLGYVEYLEGIEIAAERYKMFELIGEIDSYAYRKIVKINEAYAKLDRIELEPAQSAGVEMAANSVITDVLAVITLLCVAVTVWLKEKEQKVMLLIRTTYRGRGRLAVSKLSVMIGVSIFLSIGLYGGNAIAASVMYGLGDLGRPLATVYNYGHTMWEISVGEFLVLNTLFKIIAYIWLAILISSVCCKFTSSVATFGIIIVFGAVGCLMYYKIPFLSKFAVLKFFNPFAILKTELLFKDFMGFDFFGYPIDYRVCMAVVLFAGIVLFSMAVLLFFADYIIKGSGRIHIRVPAKISLYIRRFSSKFVRHTNLLLHELHRLLICYGIGVLLLIFIIFVAYDSMPYKVKYPSLSNYASRVYLEELSGPLTQGKIDYIAAESERVRELSDDWSKAQNSALFILTQKVQYLQQNEGACFIYENPHSMLTAGSGIDTDLLRSVVCMIIVALVMPCLFAPDLQSGMCKITDVTKRGKHELPRIRYIIGMVLAVLIAVIAHISYFAQIIISYEVEAEVLSYPINSLSHLAELGNSMSIGMYYIIIYFLKILFTVLGALFIFRLSRFFKSQVYTTLMGLIALVVPALAVMYDERIEPVVYPCSAMLGNLFVQNRVAMIVCVVTVAFVGVVTRLAIRAITKK